MYLHEDEKEKLKSVIQRRAIRIWITAIFITIAIIYIQTWFGKFVAHLIGIELTWRQAIIAIIIANFLVGFFKVFKIYGKAQKTIKKNS